MTPIAPPHPVAEQVPCEICNKEIPLSEAKSFEGEDYVAHFCGLNCFSKWKHRSETLDQQNNK